MIKILLSVLFSCSRCLSPVSRRPSPVARRPSPVAHRPLPVAYFIVTFRHWDCFCYNLHLYRVEKNNLLFHEPMHTHVVGTLISIGDVRLFFMLSCHYINDHYHAQLSHDYAKIVARDHRLFDCKFYAFQCSAC